MALIKLGSVVTRISGKVGGQTFGEGPSGAYLKNSGTPRKSITLSQRQKMAYMSTSAQAWRELTQLQRDTFNGASPDYPYLNRVGETKFYSGYAIYTMLRNNSVNIGSADIPVPLPKFSFTGPVTLLFTQVGTDFNVNISGSQPSVEYRLFISRPSSFGISEGYKNKFFIGSAANIGGVISSFPIDQAMEEKWGTIPSTAKFYWRLDAVSIDTFQSLEGVDSGVLTW